MAIKTNKPAPALASPAATKGADKRADSALADLTKAVTDAAVAGVTPGNGAAKDDAASGALADLAGSTPASEPANAKSGDDKAKEGLKEVLQLVKAGVDGNKNDISELKAHCAKLRELGFSVEKIESKLKDGYTDQTHVLRSGQAVQDGYKATTVALEAYKKPQSLTNEKVQALIDNLGITITDVDSTKPYSSGSYNRLAKDLNRQIDYFSAN